MTNLKKIDVAERQLVTAIRMLFGDDDYVSIHTLACAAQEILQSIGKKRDIVSMKQKSLSLLSSSENQKLVLEKMDEAKNFFKHGSSDMNKVIEFNPEYTELVLWDAELLYYFITKEKIPALAIYDLWIYSKYPSIFKLPVSQNQAYQKMLSGKNYKDKKWFLESITKLEQELSSNM